MYQRNFYHVSCSLRFSITSLFVLGRKILTNIFFYLISLWMETWSDLKDLHSRILHVVCLNWPRGWWTQYDKYTSIYDNGDDRQQTSFVVRKVQDGWENEAGKPCWDGMTDRWKDNNTLILWFYRRWANNVPKFLVFLCVRSKGVEQLL